MMFGVGVMFGGWAEGREEGWRGSGWTGSTEVDGRTGSTEVARQRWTGSTEVAGQRWTGSTEWREVDGRGGRQLDWAVGVDGGRTGFSFSFDGSCKDEERERRRRR